MERPNGQNRPMDPKKKLHQEITQGKKKEKGKSKAELLQRGDREKQNCLGDQLDKKKKS